MKLLPLDRPEFVRLAATWLGREENAKWLDFGDGIHTLNEFALKVMAQRDLHVLRLFTAEETDEPVGIIALSDVQLRQRTAGALWGVLGRKRFGGQTIRAASQLLTFAFTELGLEAVSAWTVKGNTGAQRVLERLHFRYVGRLRRRHWIDGVPHDRLLYDLLASEHEGLSEPELFPQSPILDRPTSSPVGWR